MTDWDATRYHRISDPQFDWGQRVLSRLAPAPGERILDLGCGTARLTREITMAVAPSELQVIGLDRSAAMLAVARAAADGDRRLRFVQGDGAALPFRNAFDAVFSTATLHWIQDHEAVFAAVRDALHAGGRFVAQCGGRGNLRRMLAHTHVLMTMEPYARCFAGWHEPWHFAEAELTAARLRGAGLVDERAWLEEAPVALGGPGPYAEFVSCVCIRHHLDRLPPDLREPFTEALIARAAGDPQPFSLDYIRLNIAARKPQR